MIVIACAAGSKKQMAPSAAEPHTVQGAPIGAETSPMPASDHARIQQLADAIERDRTGGGFAEPTPAAIALLQPTPMATIPSSTDATCKPAKTDRCSSSCKLSDSICVNAGKICDIAKDLIGDKWAGDQCTKATATCNTSHETCCSCQ